MAYESEGEFALDDGSISGGVAYPATGSATLPFPRADLTEGAPLFVHFKVATSNRLIVMQVEQAVRDALRGVLVQGHAVVAIVTTESVEMSAASLESIATGVMPSILKRLGISSPT